MAKGGGSSRPRFRLLPTVLLTAAILAVPTVVYAWGRSSASFAIHTITVTAITCCAASGRCASSARTISGHNLFTVSSGDVTQDARGHPVRADREREPGLPADTASHRRRVPAGRLRPLGRPMVPGGRGWARDRPGEEGSRRREHLRHVGFGVVRRHAVHLAQRDRRRYLLGVDLGLVARVVGIHNGIDVGDGIDGEHGVDVDHHVGRRLRRAALPYRSGGRPARASRGRSGPTPCSHCRASRPTPPCAPAARQSDPRVVGGSRRHRRPAARDCARGWP